jgi:hypothetical protein
MDIASDDTIMGLFLLARSMCRASQLTGLGREYESPYTP